VSLDRYVKRKILDFNGGQGPTKSKPFIMGLPTGSTPLGMYKVRRAHVHVTHKLTARGRVKEIIKMVDANELSFQYVITFNMDEYVFPEDSNISAKNPNVSVSLLAALLPAHVCVRP
jgi:glucosamine-6-phosphate deaminase